LFLHQLKLSQQPFEYLDFLLSVLMIIPPGINSERKEDAADNCGCFNGDTSPLNILVFNHTDTR